MSASKEELQALSPLEAKAFTAWRGTCEENNVLSFNWVEVYSGLGKHHVRRAVRGLARKGYVELTTGFNDEGMICGKGYMPTLAGQRALIAQADEVAE